jgi:hypothetical protein
MIVFIDSGVLGKLTNPNESPEVTKPLYFGSLG